jgi:hypothetical protein
MAPLPSIIWRGSIDEVLCMPQLRLRATACLCAALACILPATASAQSDLRRWYFAEGSTNAVASFAFEEEILLGNPGAAPANVTLRFLLPAGAPVTASVVVAPFSRQGINVRQFVPLGDAALEIVSDVNIVAERTMYWGQGLFNFGPANRGNRQITYLRAGHNVLGTNAPQTRWMFAEGAVGGPFGFQTYVLVSNPSTTDAAFVRLNLFSSQGEHLIEGVWVAPGGRQTFWVNDVVARQLGARERLEFAIDVESANGVPVVAERSMYWGAGLLGGHAAMGSQPAPLWYFAEGAQGGPAGFETYVLLYNPSPTAAIDVTVEFYGAGGVAKVVTENVPAQSRRNVYAGLYPAELSGIDKAFAVRASAQGQPFVAERAVYWRGMREGTASAGVTAAARKWGFADGQEGGFAQFQDPGDPNPRPFSTYYLVLNPTGAPVSVRAVFYVEPGAGDAAAAGAETTVTVPPFSRRTLSPADHPVLHNRKFAAFFEASGPIIAERAVYWGAGIQAGHASAGAVLPDSTPSFAPPGATAPPTLTGISPNRGAPSGGTVATVTGTGLGLLSWSGGETTLAFGITPVPAGNITVLNANAIRVVTPRSGRGVSSVLVNTRGVALELPGAFEFLDPNAAGPALTYGDQFGTVAQVAAAHPGALQNSCATNDFMFEVVAELRRRTGSNRWGLNWKRGNVGDLSQDVVNYYAGPEGSVMRNNSDVRIYDIIGGHCGARPGPFWVDQTAVTRAGGTIGRWTTDPTCAQPRFRDARDGGGGWLFPECR